MIKYKLICCNCDLTFDSWFTSSNNYEKLKKKNLLSCFRCNSTKIEKTLMAPKLLTKHKKNDYHEKIVKNQNIEKKIKEYQKFIKNNFEYVGNNFAYEARSIHYNDKKKSKSSKGIYGSASFNDLKELKEEGIEAEIVPWLDEKSN